MKDSEIELLKNQAIAVKSREARIRDQHERACFNSFIKDRLSSKINDKWIAMVDPKKGFAITRVNLNVIKRIVKELSYTKTDKQADQTKTTVSDKKSSNSSRGDTPKKKSNKDFRLAYEEYIHSNAWGKVKQSYRNSNRYQNCWGCGVSPQLKTIHFHHRHYRTFTCEKLGDIIPVCAECHEQIHNRFDRLKKSGFTLEKVTEDFCKGTHAARREHAKSQEINT